MWVLYITCNTMYIICYKMPYITYNITCYIIFFLPQLLLRLIFRQLLMIQVEEGLLASLPSLQHLCQGAPSRELTTLGPFLLQEEGHQVHLGLFHSHPSLCYPQNPAMKEDKMRAVEAGAPRLPDNRTVMKQAILSTLQVLYHFNCYITYYIICYILIRYNMLYSTVI